MCIANVGINPLYNIPDNDFRFNLKVCNLKFSWGNHAPKLS